MTENAFYYWLTTLILLSLPLETYPQARSTVNPDPPSTSTNIGKPMLRSIIPKQKTILLGSYYGDLCFDGDNRQQVQFSEVLYDSGPRVLATAFVSCRGSPPIRATMTFWGEREDEKVKIGISRLTTIADSGFDLIESMTLEIVNKCYLRGWVFRKSTSRPTYIDLNKEYCDPSN